jgi:hypothetical protein
MCTTYKYLYECLQPIHIYMNVYNLYKHHKIWCKTRSRPPPKPYGIVNLLVLQTTGWWSTYKAETCSCILYSIAYYVVIPSDNLLCFWLHVYVRVFTIYIHCIIDLTQRGWHTLRLGGGSRLRTGLTGVRIPVVATDFLICKHVKSRCVSSRTSTIIGTGFLSRQ